ncbi:unnamed protein product [Agarophyton chilense]
MYILASAPRGRARGRSRSEVADMVRQSAFVPIAPRVSRPSALPPSAFFAAISPVSFGPSRPLAPLRLHQRRLVPAAKLDPAPPPPESTPAPPTTTQSVVADQSSTDAQSPHAHPHSHHFSGEPRRLADDVKVTSAFVALALGVCALFYRDNATSGLEFLTAYIIEYALSVDNLLVFLLIFDYFAVPRAYQSRVLTFGLTGAVLMRGIFIYFGEALTHRFKPVSLVFAAILLFSAIQLIFSSDDQEEDLSNNAVVKFSKSVLPVTDQYNADRFFASFQGRTVATPMLLVLLVIEISDVIFALDSVPAVLGVSERTAVIYVSNVCAILGLRSLYFILADSLGDLRFLQPALAVVLAFVGAKMSASVFGFQVPVPVSLSVVVGTLTTGVIASLLFPSEQSA